MTTDAKTSIRFSEAVCIELTADETDSLLLILNDAREKLPLNVDSELYRKLMQKLGTIHEARTNHE